MTRICDMYCKSRQTVKVKFSPEERLDYTLQGVRHCFSGVGYSLPLEHNATKFYRKGYFLAEKAMGKGRVR